MKLIKKLGIRVDNKGYKRSWGLFLCLNCNKEVERKLSDGLKQKSCGDCKIPGYKHGGFGTKLYQVWKDMKNRCLNPNATGYKDYGGRGITICPEWTDKLNGFINFRDWASSNGYQEGLQINRKENNGNYEPSNCNFVTNAENCKNRSTTKLNEYKIKEIKIKYLPYKYTAKQLSKEYNISPYYIYFIIHNKKEI